MYFGREFRYRPRKLPVGSETPLRWNRAGYFCVSTSDSFMETGMSKSIKLLAMFGFVASLAACAQQEEEEFVIVEPAPMSTEPVYTGKYK